VPAESPSRVFLARARSIVDTSKEPAVSADAGPRTVEDGQVAAGDTVIEPTGPTPTVRTGIGRPRRSWVLAVLAVAALAVATTVAARNYSAATGWRDRTAAAERRAAHAEEQAEEQLRVAEQERERRRVAVQRRRAMAEQLAVSESDAAALEARILTLASDTARAQDVGAASTAVPSQAQVRALQAQVDSCVAQIEAARVGLTGGSDVTSWQRALIAAQASCAQVGSDADALLSNGR
jgi:hypothetical protein